MNKSILRAPDYLEHIRQAIERIQRHTKDMNETAFLQEELTQDAVIRNIEIIDEAANNILKFAPQFADQHREIPWAVIYAMRNRVSHAYRKVDLEIVWKTVRNDLPPMHRQVSELITDMANQPSSPKPFSEPQKK